MNDPLSPVVRGEVLAIRAETWNTVLDATRRVLRPERAERPAPPRVPVGTVEAFALNSTGAALREYKPAAVTAAGGYDLTDDYAAAHWQGRKLLTLGVPAAATDYVVVTLEAIPAGAVGRVAVAGAVLCDVHVNAGGHDYASPSTNTTALESGTTGSIRLLHKGTGASTRRCVVLLGDQTAGGGAGLSTRNVDTPNETGDTTDLRMKNATGIYKDKDGGGAGIDTLELLAASPTQMGAVTTAEQFLRGTKVFQGVNAENLTPGSGVTGDPKWNEGTCVVCKVPGMTGASHYLEVIAYASGGFDATPMGGLVSSTEQGANTGYTFNYSAVILGRDVPHGGGPAGVVWGGIPGFAAGASSAAKRPPVLDGGFGTVFANGAYLGINHDFAVGEYPIVRGGIVVGVWDGTDPDTSPFPPPTVPVVPPPAAPPVPPVPPTIDFGVTVTEAGGVGIEGRSVSVGLATNDPQFTDADGECTLTDVPTLTDGTTTVTLNGSGETVRYLVTSQYGGGMTGAGYSFLCRRDLGDVTVLFEVTDPDPALDDLSAVVVEVLDSLSAPVAGRDITVAGTTKVTGADGKAVFLGVPASSTTAVCETGGGGEVAIWTITPGGASGMGYTSDPFTPAAGAVTEVLFNLTP